MNKEIALQVINNLPDNATNEQLTEALITIVSIVNGIKDFEEGNYISQEQLLKEIKNYKK